MITAITVFAVSFVLMVSLMNEHRYSIGESAYQPMLQDYPVSILAAGIVALTFYVGQSGRRDTNIIIPCRTGL